MEVFGKDSDVLLLVEGKSFKVKKGKLANESNYFRALFFGGLKESQPECESVELKDTSATEFRQILLFVYNGNISLSSMEEETVFKVLEQAHQYEFVKLEAAIFKFLSEEFLTIENVCRVFNVAHFLQIPNLCDACLKYMDRRAEDVLQTDDFVDLPKVSMIELIKRDSFCCPESRILQAVVKWTKANPDEEDLKDIIDVVRLPLMTEQELNSEVRLSKIVPQQKIADAIAVKHEKRNMDLNHRGCLLPEVNVITRQRGAEDISGDGTLGDQSGFLKLSSNSGIVIKLGMPYLLNCIGFRLRGGWFLPSSYYVGISHRSPDSSYYVEVSMDANDWVRVVDHSTYLCCWDQQLYFPTRVCRYIRIVGTYSTPGTVFELWFLRAMFTNNEFQLKDGLLVPKENVASNSRGAELLEGEGKLLWYYGPDRNDEGQLRHRIGEAAIIIQLAQPVVVNSMRLFLLDCDGGSYSYYIDISTDEQNWETIADKKEEECKGWQNINLKSKRVSFVKIVGIRSTANEWFTCTKFECPASATST